MSQPLIDDSYSRQARLNWPALNAGESVLWRGKPLRSSYIVKDAKQTLTGIPVAVFIAFWMWMAVRIPKKGSGAPFGWLFPAFGLSFAVLVLNQLFGHYLRNWMEWGNTEYAITNRRTIIRRGIWQVSEVSRPHCDSPIEVRSNASGAVGDILFPTRPQAMHRGRPVSEGSAFGLYAVENPHDVYRTILAQTNPGNSTQDSI